MSFMYVTVYHGPCNSFHTVIHKPQKLRGLKDRLQKLGYRVDLAPVRFVNYCMLEMGGHQVFRCNIQNLLFNMPYELDPVCQRAVQAVQEATIKLTRAYDYHYFWMLIERQMFARSEFAPKDHWLKDKLDLLPLASCLECVNCCGILTQKKNE